MMYVELSNSSCIRKDDKLSSMTGGTCIPDLMMSGIIYNIMPWIIIIDESPS